MQFVQTEMGLKIDSKFVGKMGGFLPMEMVVKGMGYVLFLSMKFDWKWPCVISSFNNAVLDA